MRRFVETAPTLEDFWRSIILFGRNVAPHKFAPGESLLKLASQDRAVPLDEILSLARHLCEHLKLYDKQGTFASPRAGSLMGAAPTIAAT